jgi:hypothetical protein
VGAVCLVGDPFDRRVRDEVADEVQFARAGLLEPGGDGPEGATMKVDSEVVIGQLVGVGEITLVVE